ncbi:MAG: hypothetical protein WC533_02605 [Candidatus Pacearchaeota archaeon]
MLTRNECLQKADEHLREAEELLKKSKKHLEIETIYRSDVLIIGQSLLAQTYLERAKYDKK